MANPYLSDDESIQDLISRIEPQQQRDLFNSFKHLRWEAAFVGRIYVVYTPMGLDADKGHRPPRILGQIVVKGFRCDAQTGCQIVIEDCLTGKQMTVGYVPELCFDYGFFVSVPPYTKIRWDATPKDGEIRRSMTFGLMFKTRSRADYYSAGAVMAETPNRFRQLYPHEPLNLLAI